MIVWTPHPCEIHICRKSNLMFTDANPAERIQNAKTLQPTASHILFAFSSFLFSHKVFLDSCLTMIFHMNYAWKASHHHALIPPSLFLSVRLYFVSARRNWIYFAFFIFHETCVSCNKAAVISHMWGWHDEQATQAQQQRIFDRIMREKFRFKLLEQKRDWMFTFVRGEEEEIMWLFCLKRRHKYCVKNSLRNQNSSYGEKRFSL